MMDITDIDSNPEHDPFVIGNGCVALQHPALHIDGKRDRIHYAGEFEKHAVAGGLDDTAAVFGDSWIDQLPSVRLERSQRADLVGSHQAAVADHIRSQHCRKPALH
ncbi:hypothetical protein [Bradyrhizobium diazoefficiens]|uniref:hypothetical protein n=1 Tax=Bradyrhizobium diazoefficiens TaxID=1355477 RepID=UPI001FEE2373|nr:hypothetical protein [Bradyrhizobium diazoefficiens]